MVINRNKHNLFTARPDLSVYTTGATTSPMKVSSTSGSTVVVSKGGGSGLTEELATKLNSIEEGAQVNQNAYSKVTSGNSSIEATNPTDVLQISTDDNIKVTLQNGIIKLEYIGPDNLWYKDANGNLWTDANVYSTKEISAYGFKGGEAGSGARYLYELNDVSSDVETPSNGNILRYDSNLNLWTLFDAKNLEVDLTPVYDQINELDTDVDALIKNVNSISKEVATNKSNIDGNKQRITSLEQNDIILNNLFDFVDGKIRANFDFYSLGEISAYGYNDGEAGSGSSYLHELNDVLLTSLTSGQLLQWDGNNWVNVNSDEIGFDETRLNQILIDYATKAWVESKGYLTQHQDLSTYATQKWVEDKKYITSSALNGYATEKWVTDKGYAVATDVVSTYATIEALNKKLDKDKFAEYFSTEMAKWFVKDDTNKGIKPVNSYGLYSDTYISAKGVSTSTSGGGGGTSYDRLDSWAEYTSSKAGYVLSALLGYDLHTRVNNLANAGYITESALSGYAKLSDIPASLPASDVYSWAKAASKPSYAFSEITNKPTTLGGYGITDTYTATTIDSKLGGYLSLSGGTIEDSIGGAFSVNRINARESYIKLLSRGVFKGAITAGNETYGVALYNAVNGCYLGITDDGNPYYIGASRYTLIHSGNIGSQSVAYATSAGDSDMLGGVTHSNYMISSRSTTQDINQSPYTVERPYILRVGSGNANLPNGMQYGNIAHFSAYGTDTAFELFGAYSGQTLLYRCGETNAMFSKGWKTIAFTDSNVASATKLQTPRSIWGQSFDGSGDVSGNIVTTGSITGSYFSAQHASNPYVQLIEGSNSYYLQAYGGVLYFGPTLVKSLSVDREGNVLIGKSVSDGYKLDINGGSLRLCASIKSSSDTLAGFYTYSTNPYGLQLRADTGTGNTYMQARREGKAEYFNICMQPDNGNVLIGTTVDNGARLQVSGSVVASGSVTAKSSSDYRLKCEFDYNVDYQERLLSLGKVCDFNYTPHAQEREFAFADDKRHTSVIWQDARKANITGFCSVEEDGYGTVNPLSPDLIFTMVGAIQQGITKTEKIEDRVVRLEKENEALRKEINDMKGGRYGC